MVFRLILLQFLCLSHEVLQVSSKTFSSVISMPGVMPQQDNAYLEFVTEAPPDIAFITLFEPLADEKKVHHMILFKCSSVGTSNDGEKVCTGEEAYLYAWARGAPSLILPEDVGFKIGQKTDFPYLKLEVHYAHALQEPDFSGVKLHLTNAPQPRTAGVFLLGTSGYINGNSIENFEVACKIPDDVEMHVFAYRTHTHDLGKLVSGFIVKNDGDSEKWELIGQKNPLLPQFFYPVARDNIFIKQNDILAGRCTMNNTNLFTVHVGGTSHDEMCNFYIMYSVANEKFPSIDSCFSSGPPLYYWKDDKILKTTPEDQDMISSNSVKSLIVTS